MNSSVQHLKELGPLRRPIDYDACPSCGFFKQRANKLCRACRLQSNRPPIDPNVYEMEGERYRRLPITQHTYVLVSEHDYDHLLQWSWGLESRPDGTKYAIRTVKIKGIKKKIYMHAYIAGTQHGHSNHTDHRNRCGLDNRRSNLRCATVRQNLGNKAPIARHGYKGVTFHKHTGFWYARVGGKYLGCFRDPISAAKAYDVGALDFYGEFAYLNLPKGQA